MQILLNADRREAVDELKQLLLVVARALDTQNNTSSLELTNAEAVALCCFVDDIAKALPQLCK
ncbi:MAG: hypothetical protein KHX55_03955 [Proteobacteria bacterium]|nr:hypothetical protein [Pseudomonadota bacterium]